MYQKPCDNNVIETCSEVSPRLPLSPRDLITYYPNLMTAAPPGAGVLLNKFHNYIGRYFASLPMCLILY